MEQTCTTVNQLPANKDKIKPNDVICTIDIVEPVFYMEIYALSTSFKGVWDNNSYYHFFPIYFHIFDEKTNSFLPIPNKNTIPIWISPYSYDGKNSGNSLSHWNSNHQKIIFGRAEDVYDKFGDYTGITRDDPYYAVQIRQNNLVYKHLYNKNSANETYRSIFIPIEKYFTGKIRLSVGDWPFKGTNIPTEPPYYSYLSVSLNVVTQKLI